MVNNVLWIIEETIDIASVALKGANYNASDQMSLGHLGERQVTVRILEPKEIPLVR
jgi:hypothetical protein